MNKTSNISSSFNMSLGFSPILLTLVLCLFISQELAIYMGLALGGLITFYSALKKGPKVPKFILYISTLILLLFAIASLIYFDYCPYGYLPLTVEISTYIMMAILYLHKNRFIQFFVDRQSSCSKRFYVQGAESAVVASRIFLIVSSIHLGLVLLMLIISRPLLAEYHLLINQLIPLLVFIATIIFNQFAILYFNRITKHIDFVPVVDVKGAVIGRKMALEAINYKNEYINPVIRIAALSHGKLYLCNRSQNCIIDQNKTDIPMECYLKYGETIQDGVARLIKNAFPRLKGANPIFTVMYHFENEYTNRLIYQFIIDTDNPELLTNPRFKNGKLWSLDEIDEEIDQGLFSACFEHEYDHLKDIIYTREKYKAL